MRSSDVWCHAATVQVTPLNRRTLLKGSAALSAAAMLAAHAPSTPVSAQTPVVAREGDEVSFTYLRPTWGPATFTKDGPFQQQLQEMGKVRIEVQIIPVIDFDTKINTVLASGEIPDVMWGGGPGSRIWKDAQDQGAFAPINEYLDKYPAVKAAVPDPFWDLLRNEDGDIFFIPNMIYPVVPFFTFYRQDVFEAKGIAEPTTIDELLAALEALAGDPNFSPLTMGYTWHAKDLGTTFDFSSNAWMPSDEDPNQLLPWFAQQKQIDFHYWFQDLYKRQLLDQNYGLNQEPNLSDERFKGDKSAVALAHWANFVEFTTNLRTIDPSAKLGVVSPLSPTAGNRLVFPIDRGFYVAASMENPDGFFQFLNWTLTEGTTLRRYGIQDEMFTVTADGKIQPIPDVDRGDGYKNSQIEPLSFLGPMNEKLDWDQTQLAFESAQIGDSFEYVKGKFEEYAVNSFPDYRNPMIISPTDGDKGTQLYEDILRPVIDSVIINAERTPDDWASALQNWRESGGDDIITELNELQTDKSKPDYGI